MNHLSHLWMTETRCAYCGAQSGTVIGAGVCSRFTSPQAEKPEPLPHEVADNIMHGHFCQHCGEYFESIHRRNLCPARNEPPAETTGTPWVDEALPPRETAEAPLPRIPFYLTAALHNAATADDAETRERMLLLSVQYIFAECRKIAREEADKVRPSFLDKIFDIAHGAACKEMERAKIVTKPGYSNSVTVEIADTLRIVPGKEGE